jgi:alanyl-tRNA synthetase
VETLAEKLNSPQDQVVEATDRVLGELKEQKKRLEQYSQLNSESKVKEMLVSAPRVGDVRVVVHLVDEGEDPDGMSKVLASEPKVVAVIASMSPAPKVLVSRSADVELDSRAVLKEVMSLVGGGGGGRKEFAQGGGGDPAKVQHALEKAPEIIRSHLDNA